MRVFDFSSLFLACKSLTEIFSAKDTYTIPNVCLYISLHMKMFMQPRSASIICKPRTSSITLNGELTKGLHTLLSFILPVKDNSKGFFHLTHLNALNK